MATLFTPNYKLDLYAEDDRPNLRDQYNAAMGKIDTELKTLADATPTIDTSNLAPKVHTTENGDTYGRGTEKLYGHVRISDSIPATSSRTSIAASTYSVNAWAAPKNHASSSTTYGAATSSNYGHVLLHDTITNTNYGAASTTAVRNYVAAQAGGGETWMWVAEEYSLSKSSPATCRGTLNVGYTDHFIFCSFDCEYLSFSPGSTSNYADVLLWNLTSGVTSACSVHQTILYQPSPFKGIELFMNANSRAIYLRVSQAFSDYVEMGASFMVPRA